MRRNYDRSGPWGPLKGLAVTGLRSQQGNKALPSPHGARKENQRRASKQAKSQRHLLHLCHLLPFPGAKENGVNPEAPSPYTGWKGEIHLLEVQRTETQHTTCTGPNCQSRRQRCTAWQLCKHIMKEKTIKCINLLHESHEKFHT